MGVKYNFIGKQVMEYVSKKDNMKKTVIKAYIAESGGNGYEGCRILEEYSFGSRHVLSFNPERYEKSGLSKIPVGSELDVIFDGNNNPVYFMKA